MKRDFTYIEDILEGTIAALERPYPNETFNRGNSQVIELLDFIEIIERSHARVLGTVPRAIIHGARAMSKRLSEEVMNVMTQRSVMNPDLCSRNKMALLNMVLPVLGGIMVGLQAALILKIMSGKFSF